MCDFCHDDPKKRKPLDFVYDGVYALRIVKLTPLPAIDLTTGKVAESADPPFWELFMEDSIAREEGLSAEREAYPIRYCPVCGRLLPTDKE
jgi:hypothetical protein